MTAIHDISLDQYDGGLARGAVALSLSAPSRQDRLHRFRSDGWEIELRRGRDRVVARTIHALAGDSLIEAAIAHAHRALDLTSVEEGDHLVTRAPAEDFISFEFENGRRMVRLQSAADFPIGVSVNATVIRSDGTEELPVARRELDWTPAFRFYRISQASRDLFDAFRNMFLGLESVLDQLFPKGTREGERAWLLRSVTAAGTRVNLVRLATPGAVDPARDLVDRIYEIRVHLFHAKTGRSLIPDERVSYIKVAECYPVLLALWTEIVRGWLSLQRGGGAITHEGFRTMIEKSCASAKIGITADDTSPTKAEVTPSPRGLPVQVFTEPLRIVEIRPGQMGLQCRAEVSALPTAQVIGRVIVLMAGQMPLMINAVRGCLTLDGANIFEALQILRLVNSNQPRTEFA